MNYTQVLLESTNKGLYQDESNETVAFEEID